MLIERSIGDRKEHFETLERMASVEDKDKLRFTTIPS
jgi:hypothetical protein